MLMIMQGAQLCLVILILVNLLEVLHANYITSSSSSMQLTNRNSTIDQKVYESSEDIQGPSPRVQLLYQDNYIVLDNGIIQVTVLNPEGSVIKIHYNGIANLLEQLNDESDRGYWDVVWKGEGVTRKKGNLDRLPCTDFKVIVETDEQVEVSFTRTWNSSFYGKLPPLNIDKRFVMLRGSSGFYAYAIYERPKDFPGFTLANTRLAFKLNKLWFNYMAMADDRQRQLPLPDDRSPERSEVLAYPEAVLLTNPIEPEFKGEVDDKYQYSGEAKDIQVHGWICSKPATGLWQIIPNNEFRSAGPTKQYLTSHVGPTSLSVLLSTHYSGEELMATFEDGEPWKKVLGPLFVYANSMTSEGDSRQLWEDAKEQLSVEAKRWPYSFAVSDDFPSSDQRGSVNGSLLVYDRYLKTNTSARKAYVGLAAPGEVGSWQRESKGYQFWTRTDDGGHFTIENIRPGNYNLYALIPGFIGDYRYNDTLNISAGSSMDMGDLVYDHPRDGPILWEIGIPDRSAGEFFVPDPDPKLVNPLYLTRDKYRQYGLWERYTDLYPDEDLVYTVNVSDYQKDWFFAQVTRNVNNTYQGTTWQIKFQLDKLDPSGTYYLRIALASATSSELQVRINDRHEKPPLFTSGLIGYDNTIARHGIHGLYWLYNVSIPGDKFLLGNNTIFLTQAWGLSPWRGILYDYIRLEAPVDDVV
ncbi:probable rhamnogalacturonate lyase B isoform X2 [Spinacia oleracea]|uniref:Probable rhamnogalacturonate lyase B isoform X2 n=1 Tax=Spinacia oleracea TaxID=3562 RepID=A0A9R0IQ17_SPIOL|nr:probable rhamnogalacturonate lyase B isoform X2 [Spinacia oleracea]